jgi:general nucleoside transport system permease protein
MTLASIDWTPLLRFPLEWAALALLVVACVWWERAGASGLGVEGAAAAAMTGLVLGYGWTGSYSLALAVGLGFAVVFAALAGTLLHWLRADPAVGSFALGLVPISGLGLLMRAGPHALLEEIPLPGIVRGTVLERSPGEDLLMNPVLWAAPLVVALAAWILWQTPFGLRVRAFGEAPSLRLPGARAGAYRVLGLVLGAAWALPGAALLLSAHRANPPSGVGYLALICAVASRWSIAFAILLAMLPALVRSAIPATAGTPFGFAVEAAPFLIAVVYLAILSRRALRMPESTRTRVDPDVL